MKRRLSLILALLMAASAVSCGSTGSGGETTSGSGGETGTASETEAETTDIVTGLTPELREQLGLDGYEFNVMLTQQGTDWANTRPRRGGGNRGYSERRCLFTQPVS